jgi:2-polyprenyl-6-methoxyphenol hydroxylase-like FAD-dependent oxidoreductase
MKQALIRHALIVGAGISGMAAAIELRKRGIEVDLVEIDPGWRSDDTAISISDAGRQAFRTLGILELYLAQAPGTPVPRPVLARMLADAAIAAGADVRLGTTVKSFRQDAGGVDVEFTDTRGARYDLLVGADGVHSKMRELVLRGAPRAGFTAHVHWCARLDRDAQPSRPALERLDLPLPWHHGRAVLIGDAVHGAPALSAPDDCLGIEDAIVLAHELGHAPSVAQALARFGQRSWTSPPNAERSKQ